MLSALVRKVFSAVPRKEYKRFFSTAIMFSFISITYAIKRRIKDAIIGDRANCVELTSVVKTAIILPLTFIIIIIYQWWCGRATKEQKDRLIYKLTIPYIIFFAVFAMVDLCGGTKIFKSISPSVQLDTYVSSQSAKVLMKQCTILLSNIYYVLFYVFAETYGTLILSFCFWRFLNEYTPKEEARSFYPYYLFFGSIGNMASGFLGIFISYILEMFVKSATNRYSEVYVAVNSLVCVFAMIMSLLLYRISLKEYRRNENEMMLQSTQEKPAAKKSKKKVSFFDGLKVLGSSRIIFMMNLCVIGYMSAINLVEVSWKKSVKNYFLSGPVVDKSGYNRCFSATQLLSGFLTIISAYLSKYTLTKLGWRVTALLSPIVLGITGMIFFVAFQSPATFAFVISDPVLIAPIFGAIQNAFSKSLKYSAFDSTKETAFLYLDKDLRDRGKAAIDILGVKVGKGLGAFLQWMLILIFVPSNLLAKGQEIISKYLIYIFAICIALWLYAVFSLANALEKKDKETESMAKENTPPVATPGENKKSSKIDNSNNSKDTDNNNNEQVK